MLRVAHVAINDLDPSLLATICIRRPGDTDFACVPYLDAAANDDKRLWPSRRLPVTIGDLTSGDRLDIEIREGSTVVASGRGLVNDTIKVTALCIGLRIWLNPSERISGKKTYMLAFLDEPESAPGQ